MKRHRFLKAIGLISLGMIACFAFSFLLMSLWNWLIPELFHGPVINMAQALGLFVLSKILFSGFGGGWRHHSERRKMWRQKFEAKISQMSPEEKERLRKRFYSRCYPFEDSCIPNDETTNPLPNG